MQHDQNDLRTVEQPRHGRHAAEPARDQHPVAPRLVHARFVIRAEPTPRTDQSAEEGRVVELKTTFEPIPLEKLGV